MYIEEIKSMGADYSDKNITAAPLVLSGWGLKESSCRCMTKEAGTGEGREGKVFQKHDVEIGGIFILSSWYHRFLW